MGVFEPASTLLLKHRLFFLSSECHDIISLPRDSYLNYERVSISLFPELAYYLCRYENIPALLPHNGMLVYDVMRSADGRRRRLSPLRSL